MAFIFYIIILKMCLCWISALEADTIDVNWTIPSGQTENRTENQNNANEEISIQAKRIFKRPLFADVNGGNFRPQRIPPTTPWLLRPQRTSSKPHIVDMFQKPSKGTPSPGFIWGANPTTTSTVPPHIRPPINSISEGSSNLLQIMQPDKTSLPRPEKTTFYPQLDNRFKETTQFPYTEVIKNPTRPSPNRPFYAGQTGGNYHPQLIPPGKPWPARPEDYVTSNSYLQNTRTSVLMDHQLTQTSFPLKPITPEQLIDVPDKSQHQSHTCNENDSLPSSILNPNMSNYPADIEENVKPILAPPTKPFSEKPQNDQITNLPFTVNGCLLSSSPTNTPLQSESLCANDTDKHRPAFTGQTDGSPAPQIIHPEKPFEDMFEEVVSQEPTRPPLHKPPFAGLFGGNFKPQIVPPGKPWPASPNEDKFIVTDSKPLEDTKPSYNRPPVAGGADNNFTFQNIPHGKPLPSKPMEKTSLRPFEDMFAEVVSKEPTGPPSNRPPFAGLTGGNSKPHILPSGEPWPAKPNEDKFSLTTTFKPLQDIIEEAITKLPTRPSPNRPPFAGATGGNFTPQIIPPGKPLPSKPFEDMFEEVVSKDSTRPGKPLPSQPIKDTTSRPFEDMFEEVVTKEPTRPRPNRPPFAGLTGGNSKPHTLPPGEPWPTKPNEDILILTTTFKPLQDMIEESPTQLPTRPSPNRPPFAGATGGNFTHQIIPPGKPLPSKPIKDTTSRPFEDMFEEVVSKEPIRPLPNRPPFAGLTDGNSKPHILSSGEPWPAKPNDDKFSLTTTIKPLQDMIAESSTKIPTRPLPNRPPFAGATGGNFTPQIIPPGKPLPSKPIKNTTSRPFEDMFEEVVSKEPTRPRPNRPPFAGLTGGNSKPHTLPPGEPWPTKSNEDKLILTTTFKPLQDMIEESSTKLPTRPFPHRPPFAGATGGNFTPQIIPPGKPLPSKPIKNTTSRPFEDMFEEVVSKEPTRPGKPLASKPIKDTTSRPFEDMFEEVVSQEPIRPLPNRPPFAGLTGGNSKPHTLSPGEPWPAKPNEDKFSLTTTIKPLQDMVEAATTKLPTRPSPNRPPFAGATGGNFKPQIIPPGKPLPSKPIKNTTSRPFEDMFEEVVSKEPTRPRPNRPPFAGLMGGNFKPRIIPAGEPWPADPNENKSILTASKPIEDMIQTLEVTRYPSYKPTSAGALFIKDSFKTSTSRTFPDTFVEVVSEEPAKPMYEKTQKAIIKSKKE